MSLALSMPEWSLLFFVGVFLAMLAWLFVFRKRGWEREARLPLDLDERGAGRTDGARTDSEGSQSHG
jgi:cbb3-type cytochrome oxidase subunit 3